MNVHNEPLRTASNEETFFQYFLVILKRKLSELLENTSNLVCYPSLNS